MPHRLSTAVAGAAALTVLLTVSTALPASARPTPADLSPDSVNLYYNRLPCDPADPIPADAQLAAQLNPRLNGTLRGHLDAYRISCARVVVQTVAGRGLNERAAAIAVVTTIVESTIENLDSGDRDSVGLFQQRANWGTFDQRTNPVHATTSFVNRMIALYPDGSWNDRPIGEVCQRVQASAFPDRYGVQASDGITIARALPTVIAPSGSSLSGDGRAEIVNVEADGTVRAWRNVLGFETTPWGGDSKIVGTGFTDPARLHFA
ncbi:hypothetical protein [Actinosynnema sp. NPDC020468]|uniref:hypothetical protein n=1 Tax=Actinosynnema sp. NPDC020468 TaxID=3154488 RepID=UPI0033FBEDF0